jgi:hypothetical protein
VSEIFGDQPLSESVLPTFKHARSELLSADALIIPSTVRILCALAHIEDLDSLCSINQVRAMDFINPVNLTGTVHAPGLGEAR